MNMWRYIGGILGLLVASGGTDLAAAKAELGPGALVTVTQGRVSGVAGADPAITVFKGLPFAAPPVGDLRWRAPQPAAAWEGVRVADEFCLSCMQADQRSYLPWTEEYMFRNGVSEDCLALNIWTPARSADERLPVFVYIHGGAYWSGSGEVVLYDGEGLAKKGVIVVTVNYRLGVFGFLAHPELTAESPEHASGNYAFMDMIAALRWVQENISAFGGDPGRVTIGGQSAGANAVHHLSVSPQARRLFHGVIAQSGPWRQGMTTPTLAEGEKRGTDFGAAAGAPTLVELRALSAEELFARYQSGSLRFGPVIDGWVIPDQVTAIHEGGRHSDVPLLTGWTADEGSSQNSYGRATLEEFKAQATERYGDRAAEFLALYPVSTDADAGAMQKQSMRDGARANLSWWTGFRARTGTANSWAYFFDRAIPWPDHPEYGAFHSGELPYMFNNLRLMDRPWDDVDRNLADQMSDYWVNFIKRGDPNGPGLPAWPKAGDRLMRLGAKPGAEPILGEAKLKFFLRP